MHPGEVLNSPTPSRFRKRLSMASTIAPSQGWSRPSWGLSKTGGIVARASIERALREVTDVEYESCVGYRTQARMACGSAILLVGRFRFVVKRGQRDLDGECNRNGQDNSDNAEQDSARQEAKHDERRVQSGGDAKR